MSASNSEDASVLWGFIQRYAPGATPEEHPLLDHLVGYAIRYFHDFVKPNKSYRAPTDQERAALSELNEKFAGLPDGASGEDIQTSFTRSARRTSLRIYATGSVRSMRCCWGKARGRALATSWSFTGWKRRGGLLGEFWRGKIWGRGSLFAQVQRSTL